jgi:hypothetical protein|eukprot:COSAG01_NODE_9746_length_2355_cov_6.472961_3_plen_132_part_00
MIRKGGLQRGDRRIGVVMETVGSQRPSKDNVQLVLAGVVNPSDTVLRGCTNVGHSCRAAMLLMGLVMACLASVLVVSVTRTTQKPVATSTTTSFDSGVCHAELNLAFGCGTQLVCVCVSIWAACECAARRW